VPPRFADLPIRICRAELGALTGLLVARVLLTAQLLVVV
jgi:hypothetical protein